MTLSMADIRAVLGPVDETVLAEVLRLDPTLADLDAAKAWIHADEALANDHREPPSGTVAKLIDVLVADDLDEESGAPLG